MLRMLTFTRPLLFDHFQFAWIHGPDIPGYYAILLFTALDLAFITSPIHKWVLLLLWLSLFILSGVISPLISSSILGTYKPGEFIFWCPIFVPFHGVLKAIILKWFAIPFSSGPRFVRTPQHDPSIGWPYMVWLIDSLILTRLWSMWSDWLVFCDCDFQSVCPLMEKDNRLMEASW